MNRLPGKEEILEWIEQNPTLSTKRDIARAFGIKGADRIELKRILRELEAEGHLRRHGKRFQDPDKLPPVAVLQVLPPDEDGDLFAHPLEWLGASPEPRALIVASPRDPALAAGDRILARLKEVKGEAWAYEARVIRRIGRSPVHILGVFRKTSEGGRIKPVDKGADREWRVAPDAQNGARDGELVEAELAGPKGRMGLPAARIVKRLGNPSAPRAVSLIAIHQHGIPDHFPREVLDEAEAQGAPGLEGREDLRELPLVTIDPADARDHDDAVWAEPDSDPKNEGGHIVWVTIADVAAHVRPGSALDHEARRRGNSTYFPDRVVPMLPDRLSGDLCSLHEGLERPCIALRMQLDAKGRKISHRFMRAVMKSAASLTYEEVQAARDGAPSERIAPLMDRVIAPLYAAWEAADKARAARQPLDLDLPERKIVLSDEGKVTSVALRERLDAHRLIEEFMILANVSAAEELIRRRQPLLFRVHEEPSPEKLEALREVAQACGLSLPKGQVLKTAHLNRLLADARKGDFADLIAITTLRSLPQAYYSPQNLGHFGLALKAYAHFTSPIRRYADLVVHRALIAAHGWGWDGLRNEEIAQLDEIAQYISETERRSMAAERDTNDRYLAAYLSERVGNEFTGRISGVARFGAFVKLDETGADGLIPVRSLGREYFEFDGHELVGSETGLTLGVGKKVTVRLSEAVPVTGGLLLELLEIDEKRRPIRRRQGSRSAPRAARAGKGRRKAKQRRGKARK